MSEEKPTFKVTDRRLFNADGTPRQIEREEETPQAAQTEAPADAPEAATATAANAAADTNAPRERAQATSGATTEQRAASQHAHETEPTGADPTPFANLV